MYTYKGSRRVRAARPKNPQAIAEALLIPSSITEVFLLHEYGGGGVMVR